MHYFTWKLELVSNILWMIVDRCVGSCNTRDDLFNKVCVPNETTDLNLYVFNMITGINQSRTLTKHM